MSLNISDKEMNGSCSNTWKCLGELFCTFMCIQQFQWFLTSITKTFLTFQQKSKFEYYLENGYDLQFSRHKPISEFLFVHRQFTSILIAVCEQGNCYTYYLQWLIWTFTCEATLYCFVCEFYAFKPFKYVAVLRRIFKRNYSTEKKN